MELNSLTQQSECAGAESGCLRILSECLGDSSMHLGVPFIAPRQLGVVEDQQGRLSLPSVEWRTRQSGARKSPRGGVNRAKLKFSKMITTTSRVSVRNIIDSTREGANKSQANNQVRHADLFYRGSVLSNLLLVEEATKAGSLSTLTLSQTIPRTE
jgi:hypothetical protein